MGTEQLPASTYAIAGAPSVAGYEVINATYGFDEDSEDKQGGDGRHKAKIAYSRRRTLQLELEALSTATNNYVNGGGLTAAFVPGTPAVWKIRDVSRTLTRGVTGITLDLISLVDELAPA